MIKSLGDVGFPLPASVIGLAEDHPEKCRCGWPVIKRIE